MRATTRREALGLAIGAAATGLSGRSGAIDPVQRTGGSALKLGCCAYSYRDNLTGKLSPRMSMFDFVETAARLGLDGVELTEYYFPKPLPGDFIPLLKRRCFLLGLDVSASAMGSTLTHPSGPDRDKQLATIRAWMDVCEQLGAPCLRLFAGPARPGQSDEDGRKCVVESIEALGDHAAKRGVVMGLENHGGVVSDPEGTLAIASAVRSQFFGINLDTGNFHGDDPYADLARVAPYAVNVHVKIQVAPKGKPAAPMDYRKIVALARAAGYRGFLSLEYEGAEKAETAVPRLIGQIRAAIG